MRRTAFTIFELMIALAILVALAAIVVPSLSFQLTDARNADAQDRITNAIVMARHDARLDGRAVEVFARRDTRDRVRIVARPLGDEEDEAFERTDGRGFEDGRGSLDEPSFSDEIPLGEREYARLDPSFSISGEPPPPAFEEGLAFDAHDPPYEDRGERTDEDFTPGFEMAGRATPIAVLLPDGSAIQSGPLYLTGREDRSFEITIAGSTGRVAFIEIGEEMDALMEEPIPSEEEPEPEREEDER